MRNRHITLQVSFVPRICFKRNQDRSGLTPKESNYSEDESLWSETFHNSLLHEILLRRNQADDLKLLLCNFDSNFIFLFDMGNDIESSLTNVLSPSEDDLESENLGKIYPKNKKNLIRRLPQWDSDAHFEPIDLMMSDQLLTGNQICSCRISCKSLRCSCVKAAKSCGTEGSVCLCTNCDNPLNVLDSFGINLDFSLNDSCLFQNIYRIAKLRNFLLKCVKLSCCNTVARVLDCIPGTILCPNTECNERLEFSWCQFIICYPERNPRNHCSFCGLCCFSNKRHCPICNRCYMVSPKSPDCPNCRGCGFAMEPINQDLIMQDSYLYSQPLIETLSMKSCSKPKIVLLDSSGNVKLKDSSGEQECSTSLKSNEINIGIYSQNGDEKSELQGRLKEAKQLEKENTDSEEDNCKIHTENAREELTTASQNVKISAVNTNKVSS